MYSHRTLPGPGRQRAGAPPSTPRGAVLGAQHFFIGGLRHLGLILSRLLFYVYVCVWVSCFTDFLGAVPVDQHKEDGEEFCAALDIFFGNG